jgi:hypothetical protein
MKPMLDAVMAKNCDARRRRGPELGQPHPGAFGEHGTHLEAGFAHLRRD